MLKKKGYIVIVHFAHGNPEFIGVITRRGCKGAIRAALRNVKNTAKVTSVEVEEA